MNTNFIKLPAEFKYDRIFLYPTTENGEQLEFYTDTGGGGMMIDPDIVSKLNLTIFKRKMENDEEVNFIKFPQFKERASIPSGTNSDELLLYSGIPWGQGFLGQSWFADKIWIIDYQRNEMFYVVEDTHYNTEGYKSVPIGFKEDASGNRRVSFPRIQARIDGELFDFLFDTGATVNLSDQAIRVLGDGNEAFRGTSFITRSIFDKWREKHPDWAVIEEADRLGNQPMIQVPSVEIAGFETGSVWFTARPNSNFHEYMSQWTDVKVEGALGGSVFKYFSIIIDYPQSRAFFKE